jgi:hypothetical protein
MENRYQLGYSNIVGPVIDAQQSSKKKIRIKNRTNFLLFFLTTLNVEKKRKEKKKTKQYD